METSSRWSVSLKPSELQSTPPPNQVPEVPGNSCYVAFVETRLLTVETCLNVNFSSGDLKTS